MLVKTIAAITAIVLMTVGALVYRVDDENVPALLMLVIGFTLLFTMQW